MATIEEFLGISMTWGKLERSGSSSKTKISTAPANGAKYKKV
jgi:hypothetical protein